MCLSACSHSILRTYTFAPYPSNRYAIGLCAITICFCSSYGMCVTKCYVLLSALPQASLAKSWFFLPTYLLNHEISVSTYLLNDDIVS